MKDNEQKYYTKRNELSVEKGCLMWGYRIVVPKMLREKVLWELQAFHFGVVKMKMIARSYVYWPNIDSEIEEITSTCTICVQERKKPSKTPLTPWHSDKCWSRIHSDFLGPFHGHIFMLIIDAYSK